MQRADNLQDRVYGAWPHALVASAARVLVAVRVARKGRASRRGVAGGTTSSGTQRVQAAFILVSTCGMGAFFMQTVAVPLEGWRSDVALPGKQSPRVGREASRRSCVLLLAAVLCRVSRLMALAMASFCRKGACSRGLLEVFSTFALDWPDELAWLFEISAVFMFDLNGLSVSCFHGSGFAGKYWSTICVPIFIIACTCLGYLATQVLPVPEAWKMLPNPTFSMLGMLLSALYITLVKVVVAFWECVENPAAEGTLESQPSDGRSHESVAAPQPFSILVSGTRRPDGA